LLCEFVACAIRIPPHRTKCFLDAQLRCAAKIIRQLQQLRPFLLCGFRDEEPLDAQAGCGHSEQFSADIHKPPEQQLLPLEFWTVAQHGVEECARQPAARARRIMQVARQ
jgi:hypothetical protein